MKRSMIGVENCGEFVLQSCHRHTKECRWWFRAREIRGGAAAPVHECVIGESALAAESGGLVLGMVKIMEDAGLLFVGPACK